MQMFGLVPREHCPSLHRRDPERPRHQYRSDPPALRHPILGPLFFSHNPLVYVAFLLVPIAWYVLFKTPWGLRSAR
jgi:ABC-type uncharacterized transport system permease subunit